jgi:hypothetical protein
VSITAQVVSRDVIDSVDLIGLTDESTAAYRATLSDWRKQEHQQFLVVLMGDEDTSVVFVPSVPQLRIVLDAAAGSDGTVEVIARGATAQAAAKFFSRGNWRDEVQS